MQNQRHGIVSRLKALIARGNASCCRNLVPLINIIIDQLHRCVFNLRYNICTFQAFWRVCWSGQVHCTLAYSIQFVYYKVSFPNITSKEIYFNSHHIIINFRENLLQNLVFIKSLSIALQYTIDNLKGIITGILNSNNLQMVLHQHTVLTVTRQGLMLKPTQGHEKS